MLLKKQSCVPAANAWHADIPWLCSERVRHEPEAVYVLPDLIPDSSAEPWQQEPDPGRPTPVIPFVPVDPAERADHNQVLLAAGLRPPELVDLTADA